VEAGKYLKWSVALALVVVLVAGGAIAWLAVTGSRAAEPSYGGKPVSYWISTAEVVDVESEPVTELLSDSNAVPFLVAALSVEETPVDIVYSKLVYALPHSLQSRLPQPASSLRSRVRAAILLGHMGAVAEPAVPALVQSLRGDESAMVRNRAAKALGAVGKGNLMATGALREASTNDVDAAVRASAAESLRAGQ
jgi:hypothetical protein